MEAEIVIRWESGKITERGEGRGVSDSNRKEESQGL